MTNYKHLSLEEREKLVAFKEAGLSLRDIAKRLGRSHSSLVRELKRNKTGVGKRSREYLIFSYVPCKAHQKAVKRGIKQRTKAPLKETLIWLFVRIHLRKPFHWTPEEISGRLSKIHPGKSICTEAIYQYIYSKVGKKYKPWELLVNGRIRRFIPKGLSLDDLTKTQIKELEYRLNSTPRKCLGLLTPYEKMMEVLS